MKTIFTIVILFILSSCNDSKINKSQISKSTTKVDFWQRDSLVEILKKLPSKNLNLKNLDSNFNYNKNTKYIDKNHCLWLRNEMKDTINFERLDQFIPLFKVYENKKIVSIAFKDVYDYKNALHLINFQKSNYKPISSLIILEYGGDAENFNLTTSELIGKSIYRITCTDGDFNDISSKDTIFYNYKITSLVKLDTTTGIFERKEINRKLKFYEVKK